MSVVILIGFGRSSPKVVSKTKPINVPTTKITTQWGIYPGSKLTDFDLFKTKINKPINYLATFVHWGNENQFPSDFSALALKENATLVIFWEAMDYNNPNPVDPQFSYDQILNNKWDDYINSFAQSAAKYSGNIILVPFEEANSDYYPWSGTINGNSPAQHIAAYRYLRSKFNHLPNVKFGFVVNQESVPNTPENDIGLYYPGDAYVDYVGVDGFNFGDPWQNYHEIFDQAIQKLSIYPKPLLIFSLASAPGPQKAAWISDTLTEINRNPQISGWIWFNENKEKNWLIWSDPDSLRAFINNLP